MIKIDFQLGAYHPHSSSLLELNFEKHELNSNNTPLPEQDAKHIKFSRKNFCLIMDDVLEEELDQIVFKFLPHKDLQSNVVSDIIELHPKKRSRDGNRAVFEFQWNNSWLCKNAVGFSTQPHLYCIRHQMCIELKNRSCLYSKRLFHCSRTLGNNDEDLDQHKTDVSTLHPSFGQKNENKTMDEKSHEMNSLKGKCLSAYLNFKNLPQGKFEDDDRRKFIEILQSSIHTQFNHKLELQQVINFLLDETQEEKRFNIYANGNNLYLPKLFFNAVKCRATIKLFRKVTPTTNYHMSVKIPTKFFNPVNTLSSEILKLWVCAYSSNTFPETNVMMTGMLNFVPKTDPSTAQLLMEFQNISIPNPSINNPTENNYGFMNSKMENFVFDQGIRSNSLEQFTNQESSNYNEPKDKSLLFHSYHMNKNGEETSHQMNHDTNLSMYTFDQQNPLENPEISTNISSVDLFFNTNHNANIDNKIVQSPNSIFINDALKKPQENSIIHPFHIIQSTHAPDTKQQNIAEQATQNQQEKSNIQINKFYYEFLDFNKSFLDTGEWDLNQNGHSGRFQYLNESFLPFEIHDDVLYLKFATRCDFGLYIKQDDQFDFVLSRDQEMIPLLYCFPSIDRSNLPQFMSQRHISAQFHSSAKNFGLYLEDAINRNNRLLIKTFKLNQQAWIGRGDFDGSNTRVSARHFSFCYKMESIHPQLENNVDKNKIEDVVLLPVVRNVLWFKHTGKNTSIIIPVHMICRFVLPKTCDFIQIYLSDLRNKNRLIVLKITYNQQTEEETEEDTNNVEEATKQPKKKRRNSSPSSPTNEVDKVSKQKL